ncbi:MAG: nuclease [Terriglobales bacterium]
MPDGKGRVLRVVVVILLVFAFIQPAFPWWDNSHMLINRTAALKVPAGMPDCLRKSADHIAYLGPEPDRWRSTSEYALKNSQEPDHFIDLERVADIKELPAGRYDFYRLLYAKKLAAKEHGEDFLPEKVGTQPYIVMEIYDRLKVAFREYRRLQQQKLPTGDAEANIVFYAGWLGHYVGDGANPLHTTIHYNGWVGANPNGYSTSKDFHAEFEGRFVTRVIGQLDIAPLVHDPVRLNKPAQDYWAYLRTSFQLVEKTYQLDKAGAFHGTGTPEGREFVRERLAAGTQMLLNMWYTAWEESAVPSQPPLAPPAPPSGK